MKEYKFKLTDRDLVVIEHVLCELLCFKYDELNKTFGTLTIEYMQRLHSRLYYRDFCEKYGIQYEDMTEDDFEQAYRDMWEA